MVVVVDGKRSVPFGSLVTQTEPLSVQDAPSLCPTSPLTMDEQSDSESKVDPGEVATPVSMETHEAV